MQVFVISLAADSGRRASVTRELSRVGTNFNLFDAYPGAAGRHQFDRVDARKFLIATGRQIMDAEIGCFASHRALWQACVQTGSPMLIMEDDFRLEDNFVDALAVVGRNVSLTGFIRLQSERRGKKRVVSRNDKFCLHVYHKPPQGSMCYAISPAVAKELLRASKTMGAPVDKFLAQVWKHHQPLYGLTPYAVVEADTSQVSTIGIRTKCRKSVPVRVARVLNKLAGAVNRKVFNVRVTRRAALEIDRTLRDRRRS